MIQSMNNSEKQQHAGLLFNFLCFSLMLLFCYICYLFVSFNMAIPFDAYDVSVGKEGAFFHFYSHFNQNFSELIVGVGLAICFFLSWIFKGRDKKNVRIVFGCGLMVVGMLTTVSFPDLLFYNRSGRFFWLALFLAWTVLSFWLLRPYPGANHYRGEFNTIVTVATIVFAMGFLLYIVVQLPPKEGIIYHTSQASIEKEE